MMEFEEKRGGTRTARISLEPESIAAVRDREDRIVVSTVGGGEFVLFVSYDEFMSQLRIAQSQAFVGMAMARMLAGVRGDDEDTESEQDIADPGDTTPEDFVAQSLAALEDNEAAPDPAPLVPEEETDGGS